MIAARPLSALSPSQVRPRRGDAHEALAPPATRAARSSQASGKAVALFSAVVAVVVTCGWLLRDQTPLTPKFGLGYALGVCGGVTLLLLGLYPAFKRLRWMRRLGPLSHWFRIHMILGVVAPVLILFHCNFHLGAPNSNVALISMIIVAASGVVGRYIYTHISHGLYGARATSAELHAQLHVSAHTLHERLPPGSHASQRLAAFAASARAPHRIVGQSLFRLAALPLLAIWVHGRVLHDLRADLANEAARDASDARMRRANEDATRAMIGAYIASLVKEVQFSAYERLFSLWHALHIPLFILLLLSGILHVIAAHRY